MANDTISQVEINGTTYDLLDAATRSTVTALQNSVTTLESSVNNKVNRAGDTFTGTVNVKASTLDRDGANPSSTQWASLGVLLDKDSERLAIVESSRMTTGATQTYLRSYTDNTSGNQVENYIRLDANKDGSQTYAVSNPANFRSAIGAQVAGSYATGVKGNAESTYRTGNVNLTPANIGAIAPWAQIASGTNNNKITINLSGKTEVMVVGETGASYLGSVTIPTARLSTTEKELYLTGGLTGTNPTLGGRGYAGKITTTYFTGVMAAANGTGQNVSWYIFAR